MSNPNEQVEGQPTDGKEPNEDKTSNSEKTESIAEFVKRGYQTLVAATRVVNMFPKDRARDLYCAFPEYCRILDRECDDILEIISNVMKAYNIKGNIKGKMLDQQFDMIQEFNDKMLDCFHTNLDLKSSSQRKCYNVIIEKKMDTTSEALGEVNTNTLKAGSWNQMPKIPVQSPISARLIAAKNIERPQVKFKVPVDNSAKRPFIPTLKEKPNSLKPLAILPEYDEAGNVCGYLHPYEFELMKFEPTLEQLSRKNPIEPKPLAETPLIYVDTREQLEQTLEELRKVTEIAVDVEHHSYRTFMGITCLMQLSTRDKDYIFDALALRDNMHILNLVLTDPKILKIFHGADLDIEWLQRDLSLYVVNMFDTHKAAKKLNMARLSLAFLLKRFLNIDADKTFQLADWRMRPLPDELITYARQDTHSLIYIYERCNNELLDAENGKPTALRIIYELSNELCMRRYRKPQINDESYLILLRKSNRVFDNRQMSAFRDLFYWRDEIARREDESYGYVLPNHMMLHIAENLPREMQGILACCNPIPPPVRQHLHRLHEIILKARDQPLVKPILNTREALTILPHKNKEYNKKLYCPHDFLNMEEIRDDLPTLLNVNNTSSTKLVTLAAPRPAILMFKPIMSLFHGDLQHRHNAEHNEYIKNINKFNRMPYKRYLAILPYVQKEKREEALRIHNEMIRRQLCPTAPIIPTSLQEATNNDVNSLPLKEQLKRQHQDKLKKVDSSETKRIKKDKEVVTKEITPTDDKLKFANLPNTKMEKHSINEQLKLKSDVSTSTSTAKKSKFTEISSMSAAVVDVDDDSDICEIMPNDSNISIVIDSNDSDNGTPELEAVAKQLFNSKDSHLVPKKRNRIKKFKAKTRLHPQSSSKPITLPPTVANFDYKQVNFKKFQGGAQRARGNDIKSKFPQKNQPNKAHNKQFNKLFTFSNVKGKK